MDKLKDRMYNFEVTPPVGIWDSIAAELDAGGNVVPITKEKKSNKKLYFILAAAACVAALVFSGIWFFSTDNNQSQGYSVVPEKNKNENVVTKEINDSNDKITVPKKVEKPGAEKNNNNSLVKNNTPKKQAPKSLQNTTPDNNNDVAVTEPANTYITIAGPEGQPVKVSSKVASLIESSDNSYPPKPVWNKKINKWKDIMKANTLTPTTGNFLDIVDLTNSLKEK